MKAYIKSQYPGKECDAVVIQGPVKTISVTLTQSQIDMLIEKMGGDNLITKLAVEYIMKNITPDSNPQVSQQKAIEFISKPENKQTVAGIKEGCKAQLSQQLSEAFKDIPIYQYGLVKVTGSGSEVVGKGYVIGGKLEKLLSKAGKEPIMLKGDAIELDLSNITSENIEKLKKKIVQSIIDNIGAIIDKTGIGSIVSGVTDAVGDLSDALDDLSDSLKDKSDDIDDAWDKVFDRFDNDEGWGKRDGYIYYYDKDGISLKGVQKINGKTYYFNRIDGAMETGWQIVDGKRCYFDKDKGYQVFLQWVQDGEDWYFLNSDGTTRKSEWINDGGKWYYVKADGKMAKEWIKVDDYWYYLNPGNGAMATSTWILDDDNKWRYVKANGAASNDWTAINGKWYYFKENTAEMQSGWFRADGSWYYADSNGAMQTGWASSKDGWSYLDDTTGKMKKNEWAFSNGNWYYFNVNGIMVTGKRYVDGTKYIFNSDGTLA